MEALTFLFTDIQGSTVLLRRVGERTYAQVLAEHHRLIRSALSGGDGKEVTTQGDGYEEALALEGIGGSFLHQDPAEAVAHLRRSLAIYQQIGVPDTQRVQGALNDLTEDC